MLRKVIRGCFLALFGFVLAACSEQKEAVQVQSGMKIVTSFLPDLFTG